MQAFWHFMAIYGILAFLPKSRIGNQIRFFRFYPIFSNFYTFPDFQTFRFHSSNGYLILVILFTPVTLVTLFRSYNQFYRAECITISGFFLYTDLNVDTNLFHLQCPFLSWTRGCNVRSFKRLACDLSCKSIINADILT